MSVEIDEFVSQLALARGLSENTRLSYLNDLRAFSAFLAERGVRVADATRRDIMDFSAMGRREGLSESTVARRLMALRTFYAWLAGEGAIAGNPAETVERPKSAMRLPKALTEGQTAALLDAAASGGGPAGLRDRAMLELLYASGLRASELASLTIDDLNLQEGFLRCQGKGGKQRVVPVGRSATGALVAYLEHGRPALVREGSPDAILFLSARGRPMTRKSLWQVVAKAARLAGLAGKVHPHTLRHCFATHLLSHGADIRAIQEMLGHADIATTQVYTHVDAEKVLAIHRKFHPRR